MTFIMPKLSKAPNGDTFARKVIPADVRDAYQLAFGVRHEERFRCPAGTPQGKVKIEFTEWMSEIEGRIAKLRASAAGDQQELTQKQVHVLVGRWYDWFLGQYDENPLTPDAWEHLFDRYEDALSASSGNSLGAPDEQDEAFDARHTALVQARVQELTQLPSFLALDGTSLTTASMAEFVASVANEIGPVAAVLKRRAGGDYRPDYRREKFPHAPTAAQAKFAGWNAWDAFEAWVGERKPAPSTVNRWRGVLLHLNDFLGEKDIALVTEEDAVAWKDNLFRREAGGRTIKEIWIAAAKRIFGYALDQKKIQSNPFVGLKVAVGKTTGSKGELTDEEALSILRAALQVSQEGRVSPINRAKRWVPWICAYTGARPGEITQLRKQDIQQHPDGFWTLRITDDAGTVKVGEGRTVVLHEHLIEQGLIDFVSAAKPGPLLFDPERLRSESIDPLRPPRPLYVQVRQKLAEWVRNEVGVKNKKISPNHAWRHSFARRAGRANIEPRYRDAFCGWVDNRAKAVYETPSIHDLADAIAKFPRYPVETTKAPR